MDVKLQGIILLVIGFTLGITGLMTLFPFGWIIVVLGVIAIVFGRDMVVGVKGTFMEHLSGQKFRDRKKLVKKK